MRRCFPIDAFAGGFIAQSLLVLWLFERFDLSLSAAGLFFFWSSTLAAFSYPVAAWIAKRAGLVNTMVFTHIPSSIFLILAAFSPNLYLALGLLLLRAALSQMDVPTRTSYVMAVVTPAERPAAASVTAVPRSLASSISPAISGVLLTTAFTGLPLILCGTLKIAYDIALLFSFRHIKPPEEQASAQNAPATVIRIVSGSIGCRTLSITPFWHTAAGAGARRQAEIVKVVGLDQRTVGIGDLVGCGC